MLTVTENLLSSIHKTSKIFMKLPKQYNHSNEVNVEKITSSPPNSCWPCCAGWAAPACCSPWAGSGGSRRSPRWRACSSCQNLCIHIHYPHLYRAHQSSTVALIWSSTAQPCSWFLHRRSALQSCRIRSSLLTSTTDKLQSSCLSYTSRVEVQYTVERPSLASSFFHPTNM